MSKKLTTEKWVEKAQLVHGDKYDYTDTIYINSSTKLSIICEEHGEFEQYPANHLNTNGCPKCGRITAVSKYVLYTKEEILETAKAYMDRGEFQRKAPNFYMASVNRGFYEEACAHMNTSYNKVKTTKQFKIELYNLVENEYDILEDYVNRHTKIKFKHNLCGNIYTATPGDFLQGHRCPNCVTSGFNQSKPAVLYYLEVQVDNVIAYKIGITNLSVEKRYSLAELSCIKTLFEISYEIGQDAYNKEQEILKEFSEFKYNGPKLLNRGNTELFIKDITKHEKFNNIIQAY